MRFKDKVAIVTGSSKGIGRAIAVRLAEEGCKVTINYKTDIEKAKETQKLIGSTNSLLVQADISNVTECNKLVEETIKRFGGVDILVNNAGIFHRKPTYDTTEEDWNNVINTNVRSVFFLSIYASRYMKEGGSIINISSCRVKKRRAGIEPYTASKAGVESITKTFAIEFAEKGIRVNAISPGPISSDPYHKAAGSWQYVPLKRIGEPEEIASVVAFLASSDASFVTGTIIDVDGGFSC